MSKSFRTLLPIAPIAAAVVFAMTTSPRHAVAEPVNAAEHNERCATRLYTAMIGEGATAAALTSATPQNDFDTLVKDAKFQERFSRFINSQFNNTPGANPSEDASYYLAKYVLVNDKPWTDMFIGQYDIVAPPQGAPAGTEPTVAANPTGLGYFRSQAWMRRYAGNELNGIRIVTAYRMMQNTLGLQLTATTNAPDVDLSANGRQAAQCAGCHYTPWFALDPVAGVLGTVTRQGQNITFVPSTKGPQTILGGKTVSDDKTLVETLVNDEAFNVNAVRLTYKYLYGRVENSCEGPIFDAAVDAFKKDKKITSALAVVAKDPNFCEQ